MDVARFRASLTAKKYCKLSDYVQRCRKADAVAGGCGGAICLAQLGVLDDGLEGMDQRAGLNVSNARRSKCMISMDMQPASKVYVQIMS